MPIVRGLEYYQFNKITEISGLTIFLFHGVCCADRTHVVDVESTFTVADVKAIIEAREGEHFACTAVQ